MNESNVSNLKSKLRAYCSNNIYILCIKSCNPKTIVIFSGKQRKNIRNSWYQIWYWYGKRLQLHWWRTLSVRTPIYKLISSLIPKGQIISKGLLVSSNFPKKRTNEFVFTTSKKLQKQNKRRSSALVPNKDWVLFSLSCWVLFLE